MEALMSVMDVVNGILWSDLVLYLLLGVGVLFTVWTGLGQYRALTHGVQVVRGKYDSESDPGAISHFQALSAALSATVGLGNIAGVAIAVAIGGPGAVFWMWLIGFVGMALKMVEVTQAMMFRNTDDPENPHGGAMWIVKVGMPKIYPKLAGVGKAISAIFCITLLISTVTGGNMFQAWNVSDITFSYFGVSKHITGVIMTLLVGAVIVGGIKRIGSVAGKLVPFMCVLYILAGLYVIIVDIDRVPAMFALIFKGAFSPTGGQGAFLGGTFGWAFLKGMQRALFSNEAGQGSAPIAHSAAKTDEPVREGIVAGIGPFIDTIIVCTITAIVILLSGAWNRPAGLQFVSPPTATAAAGQGKWEFGQSEVTVRDEVEARNQLFEGQSVFTIVSGDAQTNTASDRHRLNGTVQRELDGGKWLVKWAAIDMVKEPKVVEDGAFFDFKGATLTAKAYDRIQPGLGYWLVPAAAWLFALSTMISWSYYGEQGMVFLFGLRSVMPYRIVYCLLILVTSSAVKTQTELDILSALGTGVMLWANIPIMLLFSGTAMSAYKNYMERLSSGEMKPNE